MKGITYPTSCSVCSTGTVDYRTPKGAVRRFSDEHPAVPIPSTVLVPQCDVCGGVFLSPQDALKVDEAIREKIRQQRPRMTWIRLFFAALLCAGLLRALVLTIPIDSDSAEIYALAALTVSFLLGAVGSKVLRP